MDTARAFLSNCPPPAESLALLLGCAQLSIFGLAGISDPDSWATAYGLPLATPKSVESSSPADKAHQAQVQRALVAATAVRNVTNGVLILALGTYLRDRKALGLAVACNVVTTVADTLIVRWFGAGEQMSGHLIGVVNSTVIGAVLLGRGRDQPLW